MLEATIAALAGPLQYLTHFNNFVAWKKIPLPDGKTKKLLVNPHTGKNASSVDRNTWGSYLDVIAFCHANPDHYIGYVLAATDNLFFVDIDDAKLPDSRWNPITQWLTGQFADAYIEVSQSGNGIHIIGYGRKPDGYKCKSDQFNFDVYSEKRFIALTGDTSLNAGSVDKHDFTAIVNNVVTTYIAPQKSADIAFADTTVAGYNDTKTDEQLLTMLLDTQSTKARFGGAASFRELWNYTTDTLVKHFPRDQNPNEIDDSAVESALCTHLAWATGKNPARIERIMQNWEHARDKWLNRNDYRENTILNACSIVTDTYSTTPKVVLDFVSNGFDTANDKPRWIDGIVVGSGDYGKDHTPNALEFLQTYYGGDRYLICNDEDMYRYDGKIWRLVPDKTIEAEVTSAMIGASPQSSWIDGTMKQIKRMVTRNDIRIGSWGSRDTSSLIVYQNGILDLSTSEFMPHTPEYLAVNIMPYEYDPDAKCAAWVKFLHEIFEGDPERIALLQEFLGYCLVRDYSFHKALLLIGKPRSGKGTIGRIIKLLVGDHNYSAAGLEDLANDPSLDALRTKTVAFDGDAHDVSNSNRGVILTRFKKITGNDAIQFGRKYKGSIDIALPTRFIIAANNMPGFMDDSGAMAGRLCVLPFNLSWQGREDRTLGVRLEAEIQGIANWAIEGLRRLRQNGKFTEPRVSLEEIDMIRDTYSPLSVFAEECLTFSEHAQVSSAVMYQAYIMWCRRDGRKAGTMASLTRHFKDTFRGQVNHTTLSIDGQRMKGFKGVGVINIAPPVSNVVEMRR